MKDQGAPEEKQFASWGRKVYDVGRRVGCQGCAVERETGIQSYGMVQ